MALFLHVHFHIPDGKVPSLLFSPCDDEIGVLHIVKDVRVVFCEAFSRDLSIHPFHHPSMDDIIWEKNPGRNK
jgi:hypothetical protein